MTTWNITQHGAVGDGKTDCTKAFSAAIEAASKAGGGRVDVPPGAYLTGPIIFRSDIELNVQRGATVMFSRNYDDYPMVVTDYEGEPTVRCISPLWAENLQNISITGEGIFDGQGEAWRPVKKFKMSEQQWSQLIASGGFVEEGRKMWWPTAAAYEGDRTIEKLNKISPMRVETFKHVRDFLRPNLLKFTNCRGVRLEGPTFRNSAAWNVHLLLCEDVVMRNVTILNPWFSTNGDGLDLDACRNATISHSLFDCGDDAICIKSGKDEPGRIRGRACENITVENCTVLHGHGGVTVGSEMSGGVRNLHVRNCIFKGTDIGLRFKSTRGRGGTVENIDISNIVMSDIRHEAISLNLYYWVKGEPKPEPVSERTPIFRDFHMRNITCERAKAAIEIRGLPEMPIDNITIENVRMTAETGATIIDATNVTLSSVHLKCEKSPALRCNNVENLRLDRFEGAGPLDGLAGGLVGDL